jgi:hypothetical protein
MKKDFIMYIALTFFVLLVAIKLAWFGKRDRALLAFTISMIMAIATFFHHMTSSIGLSL